MRFVIYQCCFFKIALSGFLLFFMLNVAFLVLHCHFLGEHTAAVCLADQRHCILSNSWACSQFLPGWAGLFAFWINEVLLYPPGLVCSAVAVCYKCICFASGSIVPLKLLLLSKGAAFKCFWKWMHSQRTDGFNSFFFFFQVNRGSKTGNVWLIWLLIFESSEEKL